MRVAKLPIQIQTFTEGAKDAYGRPVRSWGAPVSASAFALDPGGSYESPLPGRERVVTTPTLYAPWNLAVDNQDRIICQGETWEVNGDPAVWGKVGQVIPLKKVDG